MTAMPKLIEDDDHYVEATDDDAVALDRMLQNGGLRMPSEDHQFVEPDFEIDNADETIHEQLGPEDAASLQDVSITPARRGRPKNSEARVIVVDYTKPASIYQRLADYGLLKKITDIVLAKAGVPWHLRADATQEIHVYWTKLKAKPEYARNQMCNYAYFAGQHAALKLRRELGAVTTIPGAAFRAGKNSSFMAAIGAAINPRDIDDFRDTIELSVEPEGVGESWISEKFFEDRLEGLPLTAKQRSVAHMALVVRLSSQEIADELKIDLMYVERLLNQVTSKLRAKDTGVPGKQKKQPEAAE